MGETEKADVLTSEQLRGLKMSADSLEEFLRLEDLEYEVKRREHPFLAALGFYR